MEDRAREEELFQPVERLLTSRGPIPVIVLSCEVKEGVGDCGIVRDELTVEVGKVKEGLYVLNFY